MQDGWAERTIQSNGSDVSRHRAIHLPINGTASAHNQASTYPESGGDAVFPGSTQAPPRNPSDVYACSLRSIICKHYQGNLEVINGTDLPPLEPGSKIFKQFESTFAELPVSFPRDAYYLPGDVSQWSNATSDMLTITFTASTRVYILLPSLMVEPGWLRPSFNKLRDPNYVEVQLRVQWRLVLGGKLLYVMAGQYDNWKRQHLRVFISKRVYLKGEQLVLGGPGLADLMDTMYVCAFTHEDMLPMHDSKQQLPTDGWSVPGYSSSGVEGQEMDFAAWFSRLTKGVKRNRLQEVRAMLEADSSRGPDQSFVANHDLSFIPPEEHNELLLTNLATGVRGLDMLCLLVRRGRCCLGYKGLKFLVHHWEDVPAHHGSAEELLLEYVVRHKCPLAVVSAIAMALRSEIQQRFRKKPAVDLEHALTKFQSLQLALLNELQESQRGNDDGSLLSTLEAVLEPCRGLPVTISDFRPLRIAFDDRDAAFMSAPLVETFMRLLWLGKEYVLETCRDGTKSMSILDPSMGFNMLINMGFCCHKIKTLELTMRLWSLHFWKSQAFFNSPRGRWSMRFMSNIAYLLIFLQVVGSNLLPEWLANNPSNVTINATLFNLLILGNILEAFHVLTMKYRSDAFRYLARQPATATFLAVDVLMFVLGTLYVLQVNSQLQLDNVTFERLSMVWAAMALFVWLRVLATMIPIFDNLGPMLNTCFAMLSEVFMFALPFIFITAGFATSFNVILKGTASTFDNYQNVLFYLFQGFAGNFDYSVFDDIDDPDLHLFGYIMVIAYTVLSGILLANLLIAIISFRYKPAQVRMQSMLGLAEITDLHQFLVERHLLCSPFNLVQLAFGWLPRAKRRKLDPFHFYRCGLPLLDGFIPATPQHMLLPAGRDEIPHLLFLLTLHPLMMAVSAACFCLHTPYCIIYFAFTGHKKLAKQLNSMAGKDSFGHAGLASAGSRSAAAPPQHNSSSSTLPGTSFRSAASLLQRLPTAASSASLPYSQASLRHSTSNVSSSGYNAQEYAELAADVEDPLSRLADMMTWQGLKELLLSTCGMACFFFAGAFFWFVVLGAGMMLLAPLYAWLAAIALSLYGIFNGALRTVTSAMHRWWQSCRSNKVVAGAEHAIDANAVQDAINHQEQAAGSVPTQQPVELSEGQVRRSIHKAFGPRSGACNAAATAGAAAPNHQQQHMDHDSNFAQQQQQQQQETTVSNWDGTLVQLPGQPLDRVQGFEGAYQDKVQDLGGTSPQKKAAIEAMLRSTAILTESTVNGVSDVGINNRNSGWEMAANGGGRNNSNASPFQAAVWSALQQLQASMQQQAVEAGQLQQLVMQLQQSVAALERSLHGIKGGWPQELEAGSAAPADHESGGGGGGGNRAS